MKIKFKETEIGMIPEDWKFDVLSRHLYIKGRIGWKGLQKSEYLKDKSGIAIVNGTQIQDNKLDWTDCGRVPEWRYDESPEIQLKERDIVMTKDGTIGKVAFIDKLPEKSSVASGIFVIRSESGNIDQRFLFYYFKSPLFKWLIETRKEGSVIPHLYQRDFEEFPFAYPLISEQSAIAKILSDLDSKIELNQQMNKNLEAMCKSIFKQWFIDFEFPNDEDKPYKSSGGAMVDSESGRIPNGWKFGKYSELVEVITGKGLKREEFVENGKFPVIGANGELGRTDNFLFNEDLILTGRVGTLGTIHIIREKAWISDNVLISKTKSKEFFYYSYYIIKNFDFESLNRGSTQPLITQTDLKNQICLIPDQTILILFNRVLSSIFDKIFANHLQNKNLSQIRDSLLPKLMSGKIRVPVEAN